MGASWNRVLRVEEAVARRIRVAAWNRKDGSKAYQGSGQ
jgi:hypothetical protein